MADLPHILSEVIKAFHTTDLFNFTGIFSKSILALTGVKLIQKCLVVSGAFFQLFYLFFSKDYS